jgi:hypothetical protein
MPGRLPEGHVMDDQPMTADRLFEMLEERPIWRAHPDARLTYIVRRLVGLGVARINIARVVGVTPVLLQQHYADALDTGETVVNARVANMLLKACERGNVQAIIAWLKLRAGWTEKQVTEHVGGGVDWRTVPEHELHARLDRIVSEHIGRGRGDSGGAAPQGMPPKPAGLVN